MTVGDLRKLIEGLPEGTPILIPDRAWFCFDEADAFIHTVARLGESKTEFIRECDGREKVVALVIE